VAKNSTMKMTAATIDGVYLDRSVSCTISPIEFYLTDKAQTFHHACTAFETSYSQVTKITSSEELSTRLKYLFVKKQKFFLCGG
jgi:hypothetical protein